MENISISMGNTWTFQHHYYYHDNSPYQRTHRIDGSSALSINAVSKSASGDSTFFSVAMSEMGEAINDSFVTMPVLDSNGNLVPETFHYFDTSSFYRNKYENYILLDNIISAIANSTDSLLPFISYSEMPDTQYHLIEHHFEKCYQRQTESASDTVNANEAHKLYMTCTADTMWPYGQGFGRYSTIDTVQWLESIGLFDYASNYYYLEVPSGEVTVIENYSLSSFNGSPVTVSP